MIAPHFLMHSLNIISDSKLVNHTITPKELKNEPIKTATIKVPLFEKYYFSGFVYEEGKLGSLDDFFGSIANCNGRFTAKGTLDYTDEKKFK